MTVRPLHLESDLHRTAELCLECAIDRYQRLGSVHVDDECAQACIAGATSLLAESYDAVETSAVLTRCADACDMVIAEGDVRQQYDECSRLCWHFAGEMAGEAAWTLR